VWQTQPKQVVADDTKERKEEGMKEMKKKSISNGCQKVASQTK